MSEVQLKMEMKEEPGELTIVDPNNVSIEEDEVRMEWTDSDLFNNYKRTDDGYRGCCLVCEEKLIKPNNHYGGQCCYSCRAFFRRTATASPRKQEKQCKNNSDCEITVVTRKNCVPCRFRQCLAIGMDPNLPLTDDEKKIRFARKMQKMQEESNQSNEGNFVLEGDPEVLAITPDIDYPDNYSDPKEILMLTQQQAENTENVILIGDGQEVRRRKRVKRQYRQYQSNAGFVLPNSKRMAAILADCEEGDIRLSHDGSGHVSGSEKTYKNRTNAAKRLLNNPSLTIFKVDESNIADETKPRPRAIPKASEMKLRVYYPCDKCDNAYMNKELLTLHSKSHVGKDAEFAKEQFACHVCDFNSTDENELCTHIDENHAIKCDQCEEEFYDACDLHVHKEAKHREKKTTEAVETEFVECGDSEESAQQIKLAMSELLADPLKIVNEFKCQPCMMIFHTRPAYLNHNLKHHHTAFRDCPICNFTASDGDGIQQHLISQHPDLKIDKEISVTCDLCNYVAQHKQDLRSHIHNQHRRQHTEALNLKAHNQALRSNINSQNESSALHPDQAPPETAVVVTSYPCLRCDYIAKSQITLWHHMDSKHPPPAGDANKTVSPTYSMQKLKGLATNMEIIPFLKKDLMKPSNLNKVSVNINDISILRGSRALMRAPSPVSTTPSISITPVSVLRKPKTVLREARKLSEENSRSGSNSPVHLISPPPETEESPAATQPAKTQRFMIFNNDPPEADTKADTAVSSAVVTPAPSSLPVISAVHHSGPIIATVHHSAHSANTVHHSVHSTNSQASVVSSVQRSILSQSKTSQVLPYISSVQGVHNKAATLGQTPSSNRVIRVIKSINPSLGQPKIIRVSPNNTKLISMMRSRSGSSENPFSSVAGSTTIVRPPVPSSQSSAAGGPDQGMRSVSLLPILKGQPKVVQLLTREQAGPQDQLQDLGSLDDLDLNTDKIVDEIVSELNNQGGLNTNGTTDITLD